MGSVRRLRGVAAVAGSLLVAAALIGATGGASSPPPDVPRYVALGDSLAVSYQPGGPSDQGYAERVWRQERRPLPSLALVKLGRGGETAASMNHSPRPGASQLERAEGVLRTTRTALVTIDIGANEIESCQRGNGFDGACVERGLGSVRRNLPRVIRGLRAAAHGSVPIVGINYYNYFLGGWNDGPGGRLLARRSVSVERRMNALLGRIYRQAGVPVADVEDAFATDRLDGRVPPAVTRVCHWTWTCEDSGDDHANSAGYAVIAREVIRALHRSRRGAAG